MAENQDTVAPPKGPKERSPSFPFIPLGTAVSRLVEFEKKFGRHPAPALKAGLAWSMKEKSSQAFQTLAALKAFGFIEYEGSGDSRMASLTAMARTYLRAQQEDIKKQVLRDAALKPKQIGKFWSGWRSDPPPDEIRLDELVLKNAYTDSAAKTFLKVYDQTIAYAGLSDSDKIGPLGGEAKKDQLDDDDDRPEFNIGDLVQWESQGTHRFPAPRRVTDIEKHDDGNWFVSVEGYPGALPMEQIEVVKSPAANTPPLTGGGQEQKPTSEPIDVFISGGRLQISANVGLKGLEKLKAMLDKYEEILKLETIDPPK